jgi:protein involved in polysaccharide export with SLBB domain
MPGDIITVPYNKSSYPTISIYGEVVRPIELPYKSYDNIRNLWAFGGGATEHADLTNIVYHSPTGNESIIAIGEDGEPVDDFAIEAGASIIVPEINEPTVERKPIVAVKGEVRNPGYYSVDPNTGLDELIQRAGGLTDRAYVPLGYINRRNPDDESHDKRTAYLESFLNSDLTLEDTLRYNIDFLTKKPIVAIDFTKAAAGKADVDFVDGDVVVIPQNPKRVYVFGRVNQPGLVKFVQGATLWDYINSAGGMTDMAEEDRIRIIRGNTNVWLDPEDNPEIFAGDQIYVPGEPDIPIFAEQQQNQLYVGIGSVLVGLGNLLFFILNAQ